MRRRSLPPGRQAEVGMRRRSLPPGRQAEVGMRRRSLPPGGQTQVEQIGPDRVLSLGMGTQTASMCCCAGC
jgi:hypothetical protein